MQTLLACTLSGCLLRTAAVDMLHADIAQHPSIAHLFALHHLQSCGPLHVYSIEQHRLEMDVLSAGSSFSTEDLASLQLGEMKTKMLLGSLTKLSKLRVNLQNGQIAGYFMHSAGQ